MNDEINLVNNILYLIYKVFNKDNSKKASECNYYLTNKSIYNDLSRIKDKKYLKLADEHLIKYIYNNDFLKFNVNINDPLYFTKFIRLYLDINDFGNTIYHNMTKYIYFSFLREHKLSSYDNLNRLIEDFFILVKKIYNSHKYSLEEIHYFNRLLVYVLTYLYMNNELLKDNKNLFNDCFDIMNEDSFYEDMKLNGALSKFIGLKEEDDIKIYYIKKAITNSLNKKEIVEEGCMKL